MDPAQPVSPAPNVAHDFSALGLFLQADIVVQGVMILLLAASVWCWTIIVAKVLRLRALARDIDATELLLQRPDGLKHIEERACDASGPSAVVLATGLVEWRDGGIGPGDAPESRGEMRDRIERAMRTALGREMRRLETHLPFLATTGSAAPFIGLFGTVWGIMNSFTSIAQSNDTSLAVVAPGIAEALFATALGLIAAIPAVIAYNKLTTALGRYAARMQALISDTGGRLARRPAPARLTSAAE